MLPGWRKRLREGLALLGLLNSRGASYKNRTEQVINEEIICQRGWGYAPL